jgi:geranylgeranyl diphosphate synthase type II
VNFQEQYASYFSTFEAYSEAYFLKLSDKIYIRNQTQFELFSDLFKDLQFQNAIEYVNASQKLLDSVKYSFFSGGKRFRPVLCLALADALNVQFQAILPFALSVEMIHTYSLIHDDLPVMDNDDLRRGKPANHKAYGEATALLAGDALLTMAFEVLSTEIKDAVISRKLSALLAEEAGFWGMISGQASDLSLVEKEATLETLLLTHRNKTSALLEACVRGAGFLQNVVADEQLSKLGKAIGFSFQIADDLMDYELKAEKNNIVYVLGKDKAQALLEKLTQQGLLLANSISSHSGFLEKLISFNRQRKN